MRAGDREEGQQGAIDMDSHGGREGRKEGTKVSMKTETDRGAEEDTEQEANSFTHFILTARMDVPRT